MAGRDMVKRTGEVLNRIRRTKIAVYGDFCVDAYWHLDTRGSEVSVETGLKGDAVMRQGYSPGGAANVAANLAALGPAEVRTIGVVGNDMFGRELVRMLSSLGADTSGMVVQSESFDTLVYAKRILDGKERQRVDFGMYNRRSPGTDACLIAALGKAARECDVVIINQQVPGSITNAAFIRSLNELVRKQPKVVFLLDTRHYGRAFRGMFRKTNEIEAAKMRGLTPAEGGVVSLEDARKLALGLYRQGRKPVFVTRGARGMLVADRDGLHEIPGIQVTGRTDPVGAGDTTLSALACCLAAGASPAEAAVVAGYAATVTVQKLFTTGTASPAEIMVVASDHDYVYQPELAQDERRARHFGDTEIEICCDEKSVEWGRISHAVFDHDGTISTLREGWELVMEPMMIQAILGRKYKTADETLYHTVCDRVRDYIEKSTGIQTIEQMEALVAMVREFGIVPRGEILDKFGYKAVYNRTLLEKVTSRRDKYERGELDVGDWTMKGSVDFLRELRARGVTLYLASGTDRDDVISEAKALGYDDLFNGGIYGAVGDVKDFSKRMVIARIISENRLRGPELACFGDGPVEMRECRRNGGIAVGIASDEVRRHGLHAKKRERLIKAGAQVIVPDFSQGAALTAILFGSASGTGNRSRGARHDALRLDPLQLSF